MPSTRPAASCLILLDPSHHVKSPVQPHLKMRNNGKRRPTLLAESWARVSQVTQSESGKSSKKCHAQYHRCMRSNTLWLFFSSSDLELSFSNKDYDQKSSHDNSLGVELFPTVSGRGWKVLPTWWHMKEWASISESWWRKILINEILEESKTKPSHHLVAVKKE